MSRRCANSELRTWREAASGVYGRLLDRTPSERSEASWSFKSMPAPPLAECVLFLSKTHECQKWAAAERMGIDDESDQVP